MSERNAQSKWPHPRRRNRSPSKKQHSIASTRPEVPAALLRSLTQAGLLPPVASNGRVAYSPQDRLVLRIARALAAAKITPTETAEVVGDIWKLLSSGGPPSRVLPGMAAANDPCFALERSAHALRQKTPCARLPITNTCAAGHDAVGHRRGTESRHRDAEHHFQNALAVEESDAVAACVGYVAALDAHSGHLEARINLGRLLHLNGELELAEIVYRQTRDPSAVLCFNLAVLLEDLHRDEEAIEAYHYCLQSDPSLHDAHFNLSRLHERAKRPREALRHLTAFWRQTKPRRD